MNIRLRSALIAPLVLAVASSLHAVPSVIARYQLGEPGSLGANSRPQDSVGSYHFTGANYSGATPTATAEVYPPAATGSTTYLDTSNTTRQEGFWGPVYPVADNFAFGLYVRAAENTATTRGNVFTLGDPGSNNVFKLSLESGGWAASSHNTAWIGPAGGVGFTANQWVHLAIVRAGGVSTFYLNGVPQAGTITAAPVVGQAHLSVNSGGGTAFDGQLDEARVVTFTAGDAINDILTALTGGAPDHLTRDAVKSINKVALGAGLASVYRPGTDQTTVVDADGFSVAAGHTLQIASVPGLTVGTYDLIKYTSATAIDPAVFALQLPTRMNATLVNDASASPNQKLQLVISDFASSVIWNGLLGASWDTGSAPGVGGTNNWISNGSETNFISGDAVVFNDDALNFAVEINDGDVTPSVVSFQATTNDYGITGSNGIAGSGPITKTGAAKVTLATNNPGHTGTVAISAGTMEIGNGGTSGALGSGAVSNTGTLAVNRADTVVIANTISGAGTLAITGSGTVSFSGPVTAATLQVNNGTLTSTGTNMAVPAQQIAGGGVLDIAVASGTRDYTTSTTFTGAGTLRKTGPGSVHWAASVGTFALASGGLIDVQQGTFIAAANGNDVWTNNKADLHVAAGAAFDAAEAGAVAGGGIFVDALTGFGTIRVGYWDGPALPYANTITFGVDNGSGVFDGVLADKEVADPDAHGTYIKVGSGTQTLNGINTYTGDTKIYGGTLSLAHACLADAADVYISTTGSAVLELSHGAVDQIDQLIVDDVAQPDGIYGSLASDAPIKVGYLTGTGKLRVGNPSEGFSGWIAGTFANGTVDPLKQGANDDADDDGVPNLVEYAIDGEDPTVPHPLGALSAYTLSFTKRAGTSGLTYAIVASTDLGDTDDWIEVGGENYVNNPTTISYTLTPGSPPTNFIRLEIRQN